MNEGAGAGGYVRQLLPHTAAVIHCQTHSNRCVFVTEGADRLWLAVLENAKSLAARSPATWP